MNGFYFSGSIKNAWLHGCIIAWVVWMHDCMFFEVNFGCCLIVFELNNSYSFDYSHS